MTPTPNRIFFQKIINNKKLLYFFALLITVCASCSCSKDSGPTLVEGKVIDKTTGNPVAGATVQLKKRSPDSPVYYMGGIVIDTYISNNDGTFAFNFEAESNYEYHVEAHGHIIENGNYAEVEKKGRKNKDLIINILPKAYLKIYVKNVTKKYNYFSCGSSFHEQMGGEFIGYDVDTFAVGTVNGNNDDNIIWGTRDSLENYGYDSIISKYFPAYDTSIYYITY